MTYAAYPAGHVVAERVLEHLIRHRQGAQPGTVLAPLPDSSLIETVIEVAFWTSLRREESYVPRISFAILPAEGSRYPLLFAERTPLDPARLARLAPAVERPGIHLGVWHDGEELFAWGTTRHLPQYCLVLEVAAPGLLVIKQHRGGEQTKFANVAVIEADQIKVVDEDASSLPDCPSLLSSLLGFDSPASWNESLNVLVQLAVSMRAHGRGGLLLVVPTATESWRESIVTPIPYAVLPPFSELADLMVEDANIRLGHPWHDALSRAIDAMAGLTAVDGATLVTDRYDLLAFGAKIARRRGSPPVEQVTVTEPIEGGGAAIVHPTTLGGTRHLSAAQFVHDQHDAVALVASQDGGFTIFAWSPCEDMVHAHRVEILLL